MLPNKKFWSDKKIFLTGDTSFKGSWLKLWLESMGSIIEGYSLDLPSRPYSNFKSLFGFNHKKGDIKNFKFLKKKIKAFNPDIIFHFAAQTILSTAKTNPLDNFATNIMGTINVIESCLPLKKLKLIVIVTSDKCYEENLSLKYYNENSKIGGSEPYSASKACVEIVAKSYEKQLKNINKKIITVRAGNVIGGGDWKKNRLVPDIFKLFIQNTKITIRKKNFIRPWQHVLDCLNGYLLAAEYSYFDEKYFNTWNFAPPLKDQKTVNEILKIIMENISLNKKRIIYGEKKYFYESSRLNLNSQKAKRELNWRCYLNIKESIEFTCNWYLKFKNKQNMKKYAINQIEEFFKIVQRKRKKVKK